MSRSVQKNPFQNLALQEVSTDEVLTMSLASGDLFAKISDSRIFRLKRAGDFLDDEWKEKIKKSKSLLQYSYSNPEVKKVLNFRLKRWMDVTDSEEFEVELSSLLKEIQQLIQKDASIFDLCLCFFEAFKPDDKIIHQFQNSHVILYRRAHIVATLASVFALSCGYHDPCFIKDLYQVAWVMDYGLVSADFSYWVALATQAERVKAGSGIDFLSSKNASSAEIELFKTHPFRSFEKAQGLLELNNPEILSSILRHHEKKDGSGFPQGIPYSLISDWEAILVFADQFVAYEEEELEEQFKSPLRVLWKEVQSYPLELLPIQRVMSKIKLWFRSKITFEVAL